MLASWFLFLLLIYHRFCDLASFQITHFSIWNPCSVSRSDTYTIVSFALSSSGSKKRKVISGQPKQQQRYDLSKISIANEVPREKRVVRRSDDRTDVTKRANNHRNENCINSFIFPLKQPDIMTQLQYSRNGHGVIRQLLPPEPMWELRKVLVKYGQEQELAAWRQKVYVAADHDPEKAKSLLESSCHTVDDCKKQLRLLLRTEDVSLPFLQYFNTWKTNSDILDMAKSLAEVAAILMDVPSVRLYQDAIFWKRIGDGPTPWHTDARMAPFDTSHMITIWIPLQPVTQSGLIFCSKSHNDFALPYWNDVTMSENNPKSPWNILEKRYQSSTCCDYMPLALGDVTVHSGWTLHCADAFVPMDDKGLPSTKNQSRQHKDIDRMALAITYVDASAPVRDPNFINKRCDTEDKWSYQEWINDVQYNSSRWDHPLVPILWPSVTKQQLTSPRRIKKRSA